MTFKFMADDLAKFAYAMTPGGMSRGMSQGLTSLGQGIGQGAGQLARNQFADQQRQAQEAFTLKRDEDQRGFTKERDAKALLEDTKDRSLDMVNQTGRYSPVQRGAGGGGSSGGGRRGGTIDASAPPVDEDSNALGQFQKDVHRFYTSDMKQHGEKLDELYKSGILARPEARALELAKQRYARDSRLPEPLAWGYQDVPGLAESVQGYEPGAISARMRRNTLAEKLAGAAPAPEPPGLNLRGMAALLRQRGASEEEIGAILGQALEADRARIEDEDAAILQGALAERRGRVAEESRARSFGSEEAGGFTGVADDAQPWTGMVDDAEAQATEALVGVAPDVAAQAAVEEPAGPETAEEAMRAENEARVEQAGFNDEEDRAAAEYDYGVDIGKMDPGARSSLEAIALGLSGAGVPFKIESGHRTQAEQDALYKRYHEHGERNGFSGGPGKKSKHVEGLAVDVKVKALTDEQYAAVDEAMRAGGFEPEGNYQANNDRIGHYVYTGGDVTRGQVAQDPRAAQEYAYSGSFLPQREPGARVEIGDMTMRPAPSPLGQQARALKMDVIDPAARAVGNLLRPRGGTRTREQWDAMSRDVVDPLKRAIGLAPPRRLEVGEPLETVSEDEMTRMSVDDSMRSRMTGLRDRAKGGAVASSVNRALSLMPPNVRAAFAESSVPGDRNGSIRLNVRDMDPKMLEDITKPLLKSGLDAEYDAESGIATFTAKSPSYNPNDYDRPPDDEDE